VHVLLLPPGAPNQRGAATTIGNPGQVPPNPPQAHISAGGQLGQAPPGAAGPNVLDAQVNVPAAGQLAQAPQRDVPAAGPDVPVHPGNDPAHPQMVHDSGSPDTDPALAQMLPDTLHNGPAAVQNQPGARGFRPALNRRPPG